MKIFSFLICLFISTAAFAVGDTQYFFNNTSGDVDITLDEVTCANNTCVIASEDSFSVLANSVQSYTATEPYSKFILKEVIDAGDAVVYKVSTSPVPNYTCQTVGLSKGQNTMYLNVYSTHYTCSQGYTYNDA